MADPVRKPTARGRPAVVRPIAYTWRLAEVMAVHEMHKTVELGPLLAERGVVLSDAQVYRLANQVPERLSLKALAALCDIFSCTPNDLVATYVEGASPITKPRRKPPTAGAAVADRTLPAGFTPVKADVLGRTRR
jgi:DNA-binding Xre family transcriptional regulator